MRKFVVLISALLLSISVNAQEPEKSPLNDYPNPLASEVLVEAPQEIVNDMTEMCHSWAKEDAVEAPQLASYLLKCVNDELQSQGYLPVLTVAQ